MKDGIDILQKVNSFLTADQCTLVLDGSSQDVYTSLLDSIAKCGSLDSNSKYAFRCFMCFVHNVSISNDNPEHR